MKSLLSPKVVYFDQNKTTLGQRKEAMEMLHIGIDMHKRFSRVEVMNGKGEVLDAETLHHDDREGMRAYFRGVGKEAVATIEATRNWYWLYELLEEEGLDVKLAHPMKVRLIAEARIKTDAIDAHVLAQLERTGFLPQAYIPPREVRDNRELLRYRLSLVSIRTGLKNRIHAIIDKLGISHPFSDLFGKAGREFLSTVPLREVYRDELDGYLSAIIFLDEAIKKITREIKVSLRNDPRAELLMSIPGISHITAHLLLCEIGDIRRFPSAKKLSSYAGLVPSTSQSAHHRWHGSITKQGNRYLRWAMVEAAQKAFKKDPRLAFFYRKLKKEKGSAKARVAVARKLLVIVYHVLKDEEPYKPQPLTTMYQGKPVCVSGHS
jgi:transposase